MTKTFAEKFSHLKPSYIVGGNVNWYNHYGEHKTKNRATTYFAQPCNLTPGYMSEKNKIQKDTCTSMFIAALFTIARTWKQPNCPSTEEWIRKMWYMEKEGETHSGVLAWETPWTEKPGRLQSIGVAKNLDMT